MTKQKEILTITLQDGPAVGISLSLSTSILILTELVQKPS